MLVLTRDASSGNNEIILRWNGETVRIVVVEHRSQQIRVGITAPAHVQILRGELLESWEQRKKPTITVASGAVWTIEQIDGRVTIRNEQGDVRFDGSHEGALLHLAMALAAQEWQPIETATHRVGIPAGPSS